MPSRKAKNTHYLVLGGVALLVLVVVIVAVLVKKRLPRRKTRR